MTAIEAPDPNLIEHYRPGSVSRQALNLTILFVTLCGEL